MSLVLTSGRYVVWRKSCRTGYHTFIPYALSQVKAGTIFDNFLITDDEAHAEQVGKETWGETKDPEKAMKEKVSQLTVLDTMCEHYI